MPINRIFALTSFVKTAISRFEVRNWKGVKLTCLFAGILPKILLAS